MLRKKREVMDKQCRRMDRDVICWDPGNCTQLPSIELSGEQHDCTVPLWHLMESKDQDKPSLWYVNGEKCVFWLIYLSTLFINSFIYTFKAYGKTHESPNDILDHTNWASIGNLDKGKTHCTFTANSVWNKSYFMVRFSQHSYERR